MNWLISRLTHWLIGPATLSDDRMDGLTLAIREEAERLGVEL